MLGILILVMLAADSPRLEFGGGNRVVLVGSTLIEREQRTGYWETAITAANPGKSLKFRNLGWSGDNVFGEARAGFGSVADGFKHLKEHVRSLEPDVLVVAYGANESFAGEAGLPKFRAGLNTLLDNLTVKQTRVLLVSPNYHANLGPPLPEATVQNANLVLYRDALRETARQRQYSFIDLYELTRKRSGNAKLTENGIHLTEDGYWRTAEMLTDSLGMPSVRWSVEITAGGKIETAQGCKIEGMAMTMAGLSFNVRDARLPFPLSPQGGVMASCERILRIRGLAEGKHTLSIDGKEIVTATANEWASGLPLVRGPEFEQVEKLRATIVEKNRLYFHRWRPQNNTYLFLFRKHEQGQNAREIPQFDPLVEAQEKEIEKLRATRGHRYELKKAK